MLGNIARTFVRSQCPRPDVRPGIVTNFYCGSIFASRMAFSHFTVSALLRSNSAAGVPGSMAKPLGANFSCRSLLLAAALMAALSLATTSGGVPESSR